MDRSEITDVPGAPETELSAATLSRLPSHDAPAPWECRCEAVVWWGRGGRTAGRALPPALRGAPTLAVVGAAVRYLQTPVGAYDEVLGLVASRTGLRPWGSVAFMSVDSERSLVGGRANWAMPKTLGAFDGSVGSGRTLTAVGADAVRWRVSVSPRAVGPALPMRRSATLRQQFPRDRVGASGMRGAGRIRPAIVTVEVDSDGPLPTWLRPGRHLGAIVEHATFTLGEPRF